MFKKILCLTMGLALLTMHIIVCADGDTYSYSDTNGTIYEYTVSGDEAAITKIDNISGKVAIPEKIGEYTVTKLCTFCCDDNPKLGELVIPGTVKEIEADAFSDCIGMCRVTFSEGLEKIGTSAFGWCTGIETVTIPSTVTSIGNGAFRSCTDLATVSILSTAASIGEDAFASCENLKSVTFAGELPKFGARAFKDCKSLSDLAIDPQDPDIDLNVFSGTAWLNKIFSENEYFLRDNGKTMYKYSGSAEEAVIPDGVTKIEDNAFYESKIKRVKFPDSLEEIGEQAFYKSELEEITFPESLKTIGKHAFAYCNNVESLTIPYWITNIGNNAFCHMASLKNLVFEPTYIKAGGQFSVCENLTTVTLPSNFTVYTDDENSRQFHVFSGGIYIKTVNYSGELTETIYEEFRKSDWIKKFADENGCIIIGDVLYGWRGDSKNIVISEGIREIREEALLGISCESVTFPSTLEIINTGAFAASDLKEVTIPSNVKSVGAYAFTLNNQLEKVVIEKGVGEIRGSAFSPCMNLADVTYYDGTKIVESAFEDTPYAKGLSATAAPDATEKPKATAEPDATEAPDATAKPTVAPTATPETLTVKTGEKLEIDIDGKSVAFTDAQPFIDANSRTQVPVRAVSEMLGCTVEWDDATKTATISNGDKTVSITIGSDTITVNGKSVKMDTAAVIANDRTYIPVRYAAEALGMTVQWE